MAPTLTSLTAAYTTALPRGVVAPWWAAVAGRATYAWMRTDVTGVGVAVGGVGGVGVGTGRGTWNGVPRAVAEHAWNATPDGPATSASTELITAAWSGTLVALESWPYTETSGVVASGTSQWTRITATATSLATRLAREAPSTPNHGLIRAWAAAVSAIVRAGRSTPPGGVVVPSGGGVVGSFTGPTLFQFT